MKFYSVPELAKILEISECAVRNNARLGTLGIKAVRIGKLWKFPADSVAAFFEKIKQE